MGSRIELHEKLIDIAGRNVYFQPPASKDIKYPAIKYERAKIDSEYANGIPYMQSLGYTLTVMDYNPDSEIVTKISKLSNCKFDRHYEADNLNHDVFTLYY